MPERIPQSATIRVPLKAYLSSDHISPATGKTIAITISKNGGAYGNPSGGATNATEIASGSYYVDLTTTDTGTLGPVFILGTATGVDPVEAIYDVVKATNAGLSALPDTAATTNASIITSGTGTDQISVSAGKVLLQATQTGVTIPTVTTVATTTNLTNAPTAGDFTATMKTSIGNAVAASAVASVTGNVGGNVAGSVGSVTAAVTLDKTMTLSAARNISAIADTSLTLNDALHCAIAAAAGQETVSGTTYTVKTPSTGTTLRIFTLDSSSSPTSRT